MANLVKITGLQRGYGVAYTTTSTSGTYTAPGSSGNVYANGEGGPASVRGFRVPLAIGRQYSQDAGAGKAVLMTASGVAYYANYAGSYGNNISVSLTVTGASTSVVTTWSGANPTVAITVPAASTSKDVAIAVDNDATASQLIKAFYSGAGTTKVNSFGSTQLAGGSNGTKLDAEPPYGVAGAPIWFRVTDQTVAVVDTQSRVVQRSLQRNNWRYISLGSA